ncbi:GntR family transcriptional regulator [Azospirillum sp. ST 5-10]|uniref:GntR family transcriptional regulator n=1 Tax=unclassified Azospirillum TaxID=2630922 RepID=UPI003F4A510A
MAGNRPIYAELATDLLRDIRSGRYPVGSYLPTEIEMAAELGVSRSTVRAALNQLVNLGMVSRHKAIGTRVEAATPHCDYNPSTTTIEELVHYGATTERRVHGIERVVADDALATRLDGRPGRRWVKVSAIRRDHGGSPPICWTDIYIDERYDSIVDRVPDYGGLIVGLIEETYGVSVDEVQQIIRATLLPAAVAPVLEAAPGTPTLEIVRRYRSLNSVYLVSVSLHPGDRFEYAMSLRRSVAR